MTGFKVVTAEDGAMAATDLVVIEYDGPIVFPMAENLREIWTEIKKSSRFHKVALRLNSPGGTDLHGLEVIGVLREMRQQVQLMTLVNEHDLCASMCVPIYLQGDRALCAARRLRGCFTVRQSLEQYPEPAGDAALLRSLQGARHRRKLHGVPAR